MAYRVIWSDEAVSDLERISQFIGRDSGAYARAVVRRVLEGTRRLKTFPRMGRVVPELEDDDFRELLIYNFRVLYRVEGNTVTIACVAHGKQSLRVDLDDL
jgi:toxin ParE1/3/4